MNTKISIWINGQPIYIEERFLSLLALHAFNKPYQLDVIKKKTRRLLRDLINNHTDEKINATEVYFILCEYLYISTQNYH